MSNHKDASYYEAAVKYNKDVRDFCNNLARELEHPVIKGWARSVARQHHENLELHSKALARFRRDQRNGVVRAYPNGKCAPWCKGGHPVLEPYNKEESVDFQQQNFAASQNETNEENNA